MCTLKVSVKSISGGVDKVSATEMVDLGSIPSQVKPKAKKIDVYRFTA